MSASRIRKVGAQGASATGIEQNQKQEERQPQLAKLKAHLVEIETDDPLIEGSLLTLRSYADEEIQKGAADTLLTGFRQMAQRDRDLYLMDRIR